MKKFRSSYAYFCERPKANWQKGSETKSRTHTVNEMFRSNLDLKSQQF